MQNGLDWTDRVPHSLHLNSAAGGLVMFFAKLAVPLLFAVPALLLGGSTPSSVTLSSSPNASVFGHVVTLSAAVTPTAASGNVTFYDGTTVLGTTKLTGGSAALTTILLASGSRSLKAYYAGDATFASSTSSALVQMVNAVPGGNFQGRQ